MEKRLFFGAAMARLGCIGLMKLSSQALSAILVSSSLSVYTECVSFQFNHCALFVLFQV